MRRQASGPLAGVRILVPRAAHQAGALSDRVRAAGGIPVEAATIQLTPGDVDGLATAVRELAAGRYEALCVTSPNGVTALAAAAAGGLDTGGAQVWAVGPRTAAALHDQLGLQADLVPREATAAQLAAAVPRGSGRVLLPRGDLASADLPAALRAAGYTPAEVVAYRTARPDTLPPGVLDDLRSGGIDVVAFTSGSTVRNLAALAAPPWPVRVVTIGPVTSAACREVGIEVAAEADPHDLDGLVAALTRAARSG